MSNSNEDFDKKEFEKGKKIGEHRARLFESSNALEKATWNELDKSTWSESKIAGHDQGVDDIKHGK